MTKLILATSAALDQALMNLGFSEETALPLKTEEVVEVQLSNDVIGFRSKSEGPDSYFALIATDCVETLYVKGVRPADIYRRVARVISSMRAPPVHLPRQWSEYHLNNLIAFFAAPRETVSDRWIAEIDGKRQVAKFDYLSSDRSEVDLKNFSPSTWPKELDSLIQKLLSYEIADKAESANGLATEVDLHAIGSASVVQGMTYENWEDQLTLPQKTLLNEDLNKSIRVVGPAGSGKTLSLCMRALRIAREETIVTQEKKVLLVTHSWAMSERIDGVLTELNAGVFPDRITVYPLLTLLELHVGGIGQQRVDVIGDDSSDGRRKTIAILQGILDASTSPNATGASQWVLNGLSAKTDSRARLDLIGYLFEEITGILSATGVSPDDSETVRSYLAGAREEWMPPFDSVADRTFVLEVYEQLLKELIDRAAITSDQFILDSIRILETFSWRMRRETEGYDFILVDELQLFDPQERAALELLARSKRGVPFITAEDPSQGVFSSLNGRHNSPANETVYLDTVHRFNREIFDFIAFMYRKFPLNATPLRISHDTHELSNKPHVISAESMTLAVNKVGDLVQEVSEKISSSERICIATLGDLDVDISDKLAQQGFHVTRLSSFDDVEQLAYSKRSVVVSPWEFVGGTQFSCVIVVSAGIVAPLSQFSKLREMISIYLACSRATDRLFIVCDGYIPAVLEEASEMGFVKKFVS